MRARLIWRLTDTGQMNSARLYAGEPLGVDLKDTVYALDASTIDLCLSVFPPKVSPRNSPNARPPVP